MVILKDNLVSVVKSSVIKMLVSATKGLVQRDQTLNPCNVALTCMVSCHPRQGPHPPYPDWNGNEQDLGPKFLCTRQYGYHSESPLPFCNPNK